MTMGKGTRVALHAATDDWMRGDRYGVVTGQGREREYVNHWTKERSRERPYLVKLDRSGKVKRFHPDALFPVN